jgi:hypothetical protein
MANWTDVFEEQVKLWLFWRSALGRSFAEGFREGLDAEWTSYIADMEAHKLLLADPIYVESEMMDVIDAAAPSFGPEPLHEHDLVTSAGFAYLPRPRFVRDIRDKMVAWRALAWAPMQGPGGRPGIFFSLYSSLQDADDDIIPEALRGRVPTDLTLLHVTPWWFELPWDEVEPSDRAPVSTEMYQEALAHWRWVQTFFRLCQQRISTPERRQAPRPARRRAERAGHPGRSVIVVKLRRPRAPAKEGEPRQVEWSHRWIVGGHWRRQWYPSVSMHRQIWISPYVKGPEEKELRLTPRRAFELIR